jgi:hypothetical protein
METLLNKPEHSFGPRIDWITVKGGIKPPKLATSLFYYFYERILKIMEIPEIDTTMIKQTPSEWLFRDDISNIAYKISLSRKKFKAELSVEFPGEYYINTQEGWLKTKSICKYLNKKMDTNLILTRIDIARDIQGRPSDYIPRNLQEITFNFRANFNEPFRDLQTGELQTIYIQNKGKNKLFVICIYFKSEEIEKSETSKNIYYKELFNGHPFIRIEARLFSEWAKKFTKQFYLMNDQEAFSQMVLSNFGYKKRAYIGATIHENQIENGNARRAEPWALWHYYFQPNKTMSFKDKFFVSKEPASKKAAQKKIERFIVMAENDDDFDQIIRSVEKRRKELNERREARMAMIAKQEELFGTLERE